MCPTSRSGRPYRYGLRRSVHFSRTHCRDRPRKISRTFARSTAALYLAASRDHIPRGTARADSGQERSLKELIREALRRRARELGNWIEHGAEITDFRTLN
jgi:hypothetical protein